MFNFFAFLEYFQIFRLFISIEFITNFSFNSITLWHSMQKFEYADSFIINAAAMLKNSFRLQFTPTLFAE